MMIEVNGVRYPVISVYDGINGNGITPCKVIELYSTYEEVANVFVNGVKWKYIERHEVDPENPEVIEEYVTDCSLYSIPGPITDYRNGRIQFEMLQASMEDILKLFEEVL